ncbi:diguanylate cyclase domain-containing protein [Desulfopila aestuarii]|nr:diguanylate cyclase [Desulfopila aestuarii]
MPGQSFKTPFQAMQNGNGMCKVLIVENNPTIIKLLSHFFQTEGCDIRLAENGLLALSMLESFIPDILVTDIIMPKISGDVLCRVVRNDPKFKDIFVVIYSAIVYEDESHIFDLEADLYIAKGPKDTLKNHIRRILEQFRSGKRREHVVHGTEGLHPRNVTIELLRSRRHYHAMMDNLADAVIEMNSAGQIIQANRAAQEILALDLTTILSSQLTEYLTGQDSNLVEQWLAQIPYEALPPFCSSYDKPMLVGKRQVILKLMRIADNDDFFIIAILQDITPHKVIEEKLIEKVQEFNAVMESIGYGVLFMGPDLRARLANRAFRDMWGITDDFFAGQPTFRDLINFNRYNGVYDILEEDFDRYIDEREAAVRSGGSVSEEINRKDGLVFQYQCVALPDGGRMLTYFDITKHKNTQTQLARSLEEVKALANRDPLTGLYNLRMLQERFISTLAISKRKDWKAAIMFIDLDGFKEVNDIYGHLIGDMVLKMVPQRLLNIVRTADTVCRIGGDEFLVIQTEVYDDADAAHVANKIIEQLNDPFVLDGVTITIGASIGISMYPAHGSNLKVLIKNADDAMYAAKAMGKQNYTFF